MKKENGSSSVHVLYHSPRWHICWNLFAHGYRKYAVNFKRYTSLGIEYCFWVSFGKGNLSFTFRPTPLAHRPETGAAKSDSESKSAVSGG
jgi:hypothetical protein